jgi:hypothetical protein
MSMDKIKMDESVDLLVAQKLKEYNYLRYRIGDNTEDYLNGVYEIYDILRENGAKL